MSITIPPAELEAAAADYGRTVYVITATAEGPPRVTHSSVAFDGTTVRVRLGASASAEARERPTVALLWPATRDQSMSLIADGLASFDGPPGPDAEVAVEITGAVRHRPAPPA